MYELTINDCRIQLDEDFYLELRKNYEVNSNIYLKNHPQAHILELRPRDVVNMFYNTFCFTQPLVIINEKFCNTKFTNYAIAVTGNDFMGQPILEFELK